MLISFIIANQALRHSEYAQHCWFIPLAGRKGSLPFPKRKNSENATKENKNHSHLGNLGER